MGRLHCHHRSGCARAGRGADPALHAGGKASEPGANIAQHAQPAGQVGEVLRILAQQIAQPSPDLPGAARRGRVRRRSDQDQPGDQIRNLGVKLKHNANRAMIDGKRIVLIDDSIVRGTTSMKIVEMMRDAGAAEVHMRIASPPTSYSCFYGVDTPDRDKLLAARMDVAEMTRYIGADSLSFVSIDGLYRAVGEKSRNAGCPQHCDACFSGDYPTRLTDLAEREGDKDQLTFPVSKPA
jgi:hypothetical protein